MNRGDHGAVAVSLLFFLFLFPFLALPAGAIDLVVLEPASGVPLFGEVEVVAEVLTEVSGVTVEIRVDGRLAAKLTVPPYRIRIDVGGENVAHRIEVIARDATGAVARRQIDSPAIRVDEELELPLQQLYVTVSRNGERVLDLPRSAFGVRDDGEPQILVTFEGGDVPMTALLLIDASDSMRGPPLDMALAGARALLGDLAPLDQMALWLFSDRLLHASPVTGFAEVLGAGLERVEASGSTALDDHLYLALRELSRLQGRRVLIVLSDGVDVASVLSMEDVQTAERRSQAMVYWIRLGGRLRGSGFRSAWRDQEQYRRELAGFEELVASSGGRVVPLDGLDQVGAAFTAILEEIREQYVLGFYPTSDRDDGSWHRVQVRVDRPGLEVRVREGYLDAPSLESSPSNPPFD